MKFLSIAFLFLIFISCKESAPTPPTADLAPATDTMVSEKSNQPFQDVEVAQARELIKNNPGIFILDVRTPEETGQGFIEGAQFADINNPDFPQKIEALDSTKTYIVYCAIGGRSKTAAGYMHSKGFKNVYNLIGGYSAWTAIK